MKRRDLERRAEELGRPLLVLGPMTAKAKKCKMVLQRAELLHRLPKGAHIVAVVLIFQAIVDRRVGGRGGWSRPHDSSLIDIKERDNKKLRRSNGHGCANSRCYCRQVSKFYSALCLSASLWQ